MRRKVENVENVRAFYVGTENGGSESDVGSNVDWLVGMSIDDSYRRRLWCGLEGFNELLLLGYRAPSEPDFVVMP